MNAYLYQLINEQKLTDIKSRKEIEKIIDIFNQYEKVLNWNYHDHVTVVREKLKIADKEIITPFLSSEQNPF